MFIMKRPDYESMLVAELKTQCEQLGLPTSGKKTTLIERLEQSQNEPLMISIEADLVETENRYEYIFSRMKTQIVGPLNLGAIIANGLSMLMISSVLVLQPSWLGFGDDFDYQLIDFEAEQTRTYAEDLVELGHPEWEGRMSGTIEEANTSQYIIERLEEMGYEPESNEYQVPMHHVNSEPSFRLCVQGGFGLSPCDGPVGQVGGSQVTIFQHRVDYVIQGFSGQSEYLFDEEIPVTDLGNGSDESLWQSATGTLGYVRMDESRVSNSQMYSYAAQNDLAGIISVNKIINCGQIEGNDCVPIFKGTNYDSLLAANGGTIPTEIPFIAMSRDAGDIFEALVINATEPASIELIIDVTNDEERTIYVPCGKIQGRTSEVIIAGATVLEMARQLAEIVNQTGKPERTIQFCTWGGEEEGLWGSRA